eukprot:1943727-Prorocentrum_lima.AAC.1
MAQVNVDLDFDNMAKLLQLTFGQQHVLTERGRGRGRKGQGTYYETDFDEYDDALSIDEAYAEIDVYDDDDYSDVGSKDR